MSNNTFLRVYSFSFTRFIASLLLIGIGVLDFVYLGFSMGHPGEVIFGEYINQGNMIFLGGVSSGIMTGITPFLLGVFLFIYSLLSAAILEYNISKDDKRIDILERRFLLRIKTNIPLEEVKEINYRNNHIGPKNLWLLICIPIAFILIQWGYPLFNTNMSPDNILPFGMVFTGIGLIVISIFLILFPQHFLSINTSKTHYEMWMSPIFPKISSEIKEAFGLKNNSQNQKSNISIKLDKIQFYLGILLFSLCSLSYFGKILMGTFFSLIGASYGLILIINATLPNANGIMSKFCFDRTNSNDQTGQNNGNKLILRELSFFDYFLNILLIGSGIIGLIISWSYSDLSYLSVLFDQIGMTVFFLLYLSLIGIYFLMPVSENIKIKIKKLSENPKILKNNPIIKMRGICLMSLISFSLIIALFLLI